MRILIWICLPWKSQPSPFDWLIRENEWSDNFKIGIPKWITNCVSGYDRVVNDFGDFDNLKLGMQLHQQVEDKFFEYNKINDGTRDPDLLKRIAGVFAEAELKPPGKKPFPKLVNECVVEKHNGDIFIATCAHWKRWEHDGYEILLYKGSRFFKASKNVDREVLRDNLVIRLFDQHRPGERYNDALKRCEDHFKRVWPDKVLY
ncbi:hypothetical protein LCGC14_0415790 [marine sediment metagenome]|uniref:Uncharacterized protein n=1 Tax=marine sediment metagenome TaxID=412755 RepID=A0A0F9W1K3_9ZZZZ